MLSNDPSPIKTVFELLHNVNDGKYVIPHFQRGYEWTPGMVSDLLISLIQDYFSGLLLFWELNPAAIKNEQWDPLWGASKKGTPTFAILDGQQRLASLYYAIYGPPKIFPGRKSYYTFFLRLKEYLDENYDEAIFYRFSKKRMTLNYIKQRRDEWLKEGIFPIKLVSDRKYLDSKEFNKWIRGYAQNFLENKKDENEYDQLRDDIKEVIYKFLYFGYVTHILGQDRELSDICGIFARINQKGMKLSTFDLMNAFLFPKGIALRKNWEDMNNDTLKNIDSNMNEYILKFMSLYKQEYCSSKYIYHLIPGYQIRKRGTKVKTTLINSSKEFLQLWDHACEYSMKAIEKVMNVGKDDFGAIKYDFIPNTTIIPVLGAILLEYENHYRKTIPENKFQQMLSDWYWSAVISGDYSGSSDTIMSEDFRDIKNWFAALDTSKIRRINRIREIDAMNLKECGKGSALYNAILSLIALNKAEDFYTLRVLDTGTYTGESIHDHHIFPVKAKGFPAELTKQFQNTKDSIVNRTLLLNQTNISISSQKPSQYLQTVTTKLNNDSTQLSNLLANHFISDSGLKYMRNDDYDKFITEREKMIKTKLIEVLNSMR